MQNLNLHNCKMNPFFSLITSLEPLCIFIFQCFLSIQINVEPKFLCNKDCLIMINTKVKQRHFCNSHWRNMRLIILAFSITILALDTKVISQLTYYLFFRKFWTLRFKASTPEGCQFCVEGVMKIFNEFVSNEGIEDTINWLEGTVCPTYEDVQGCKVGIDTWWGPIAVPKRFS